MVVDEVLVKELDLYWINDRQLHDTYQLWKKNFDRKKKRGIYSKELAIKGIKNNFVPRILEKYRREVAPLSSVSNENKTALAKLIVQQYETEE